jgi:hypothetical protein
MFDFSPLFIFLRFVDVLICSGSEFLFIQIIMLFKSNDWQFILTLFGIVSTWIVTFFSIRNVNRNTNLQISNQNKISYRPYLKIEIVEEKIFQEGVRYYYTTTKKYDEVDNHKLEDMHNSGYAKGANVVISLKNVGNGIATGLKIFNIDNNFRLLNKSGDLMIGSTREKETYNESEEAIIAKDEIFQFQMFLTFVFSKNRTPDFEYIDNDCIHYLLVFKDIDMNLYSFKIDFWSGYQSNVVSYRTSEVIEYKKKWNDFSNINEFHDYIKSEYIIK